MNKSQDPPFQDKRCKNGSLLMFEVSCFVAKIMFYVQSLEFEPIFTFISAFIWKLQRFKELEIIWVLTVKSKYGQKFVQTSDFTFKVLITLGS